MAIIAILTTSCTEDFTNPKNLVGTIWRCSSFPTGSGMENYDYEELRFTSTSSLEVWGKEKNASAQKVNNTYSYTIENITISITYTGITVVGTINNNKMTVNQNNITAVFVKQ